MSLLVALLLAASPRPTPPPPAPPLAEVWSAPGGKRPLVGPAVAGDTVAVAAADGTLLLLEARSGKRRGRVDLGGRVLQLLADGQRLIALVEPGTLHRIDPANGKPAGAPVLLPAAVAGPAAAAPGLVAVPLGDFTLALVDLADGRPRWSQPVAGKVVAPPAFGPDWVAAGTDADRVYVIGLGDGRERAAVHVGGPVLTSPGLAQGVLVAGSPDRRLVGIDPEKGDVRWRAEIGRGPASPVVDLGDFGVLATLANQLVALGRKGSPLWRTGLPGRVMLPPVPFADRILVVPHRDRRLLSFSAANGHGGTAFTLEDPLGWIAAAPVAAGEWIVIATSAGEILALGPRPEPSPEPSASPLAGHLAGATPTPPPTPAATPAPAAASGAGD